MIKFKNVSFSYGKTPVLKNFNLSVLPGETVCLFGASGCGKTTVLKLIAGLLTANSGEVLVNGKVSFVFQENRLIPSLSAKENILAVTDTFDSLEALRLSEFCDAKPEDLSGGMARRVAIARAIDYGGDILLLDEPFNGLDKENKKLAVSLIKEKFKGKTIVMVSHLKEDIDLLDAKVIKL